jgi:hypothetical protein
MSEQEKQISFKDAVLADPDLTYQQRRDLLLMVVEENKAPVKAHLCRLETCFKPRVNDSIYCTEHQL